MPKKITLTIPASHVDRPIVYEMVMLFGIKPNIEFAALNPDNTGRLILNIEGDPADIEKVFSYLQDLSIQIEE